MAFSLVHSAQLTGLGAQRVVVEVDTSRGLYVFQIVGLPDKAVEESRERVIGALRNSLSINPKAENEKVIVSLSPAELKKEGAYFDLAIALGYMVSTGVIAPLPTSALFIGELSLNGTLRPIRGLLSIVQMAQKEGITELFIPEANEHEATLIEGVTCYLVPTLARVLSHLKKERPLRTAQYTPTEEESSLTEIDFGSVRGQDHAKRALLIAAAGGHNIVLYGPPGTGKTMLAKAFHGIVPNLSREKFLEVATIYSSVGLLESTMNTSVPLRTPHHSASHVAIIGGGATLRPGDITLAHRGILYLDEFPEFDRRVIEALREPLEEGSITVARAKGSVRYPASFILLAAMNPCPCGYRGSGIRPCSCKSSDYARYKKKLSGPIMDRIDLWVSVQHVEYETLHSNEQESESKELKMRVAVLHSLQQRRQGALNSHLHTKDLAHLVPLSKETKQLLQRSAKALRLSPRVYLRTIKIARTIADIEGAVEVGTPHILEALQYRPAFD